MKLSDLKAKPKLTKLVLDDEATIERYGEPVEFWAYDRQPMSVFLAMTSIDQNDPGSALMKLKDLILDDKGNPIIDEENVLPTSVLTAAIAKVTELLGK